MPDVLLAPALLALVPGLVEGSEEADVTAFKAKHWSLIPKVLERGLAI